MTRLTSTELHKGQSLTETLSQTNVNLSPDGLSGIIKEYGKFRSLKNSYGLWTSHESLLKIKENYSVYDKVVLLISGVAAGGKDAIREEIERQTDSFLFKMVTATSRKPREGEVHGRDYYFFEDRKKFERAVKDGNFIEWVEQGDRLYGLPKDSIKDALKMPHPVICSHVEMSAWTKVEDFLASQETVRTFVLKLFVLPLMNFNDYKSWLSEKRDDVPSRLKRTGWELGIAPKRSDFIVLNTISNNKRHLSQTARAVTRQVRLLLKNP